MQWILLNQFGLMVRIQIFENPRWQMAAMLKPLNCRVSAMVQSIFAKLGTMTHFDALNLTGR